MNNLLLESDLERTLCAWLKEDIPSFDYGGFVVGTHSITMMMISDI